MKKQVVIIGGGTAGLFLAAFLDTDRFDVTIYEKNGSLGRKFLVAGDGGFNLTHTEAWPTFNSKYTPTTFLDRALTTFSNADLRKFMSDVGIPTFVGSSGRVFPVKGIKPIYVLKAMEAHLIAKGIRVKFNRTFISWTADGCLQFSSGETVAAHCTVFALGGSSWKVTGSDGGWLPVFRQKGIETTPFKPSNCAYRIQWNEQFIKKNEGQPLKNIAISLRQKTQKGEAVVTKFGIEGNAIYGLSPEIRIELETHHEAIVYVDFKPTLTAAALVEKMSGSKFNTTDTLKKTVNLPLVIIDLIKTTLSKAEFTDLHTLADYLKRFPLKITAAAVLDEAISTAGGVSLAAVDSHFQLKNLPNHYCIGEMLDWDAPTGGYLIQGCASNGVYLARHLNGQNL